MRIAVTYGNGQIFGRFGGTEQFGLCNAAVHGDGHVCGKR